MPNNCRVCNSPSRLEADRQIVAGVAIAVVAKNLGLPYYSVYTHSQNHVARQLSTALRQKESIENFQLLDRINTIVDRCEALFTSNLAKGRDIIALKCLSEQRSTFELIARIAATLAATQHQEMELLKLKNQEGTTEDQETFQDSLKYLTTPELKILMAIQEKIENRQKDRDVIGEYLSSVTSFDVVNTADKPEAVPLYASRIKATFKRTKFPGKPDRLDEMRVREIPGTVIPG